MVEMLMYFDDGVGGQTMVIKNLPAPTIDYLVDGITEALLGMGFSKDMVVNAFQLWVEENEN